MYIESDIDKIVDLKAEIERLRRELAEALRERDALLRLVDDVEQMAVDDESGCTTCLRVVNACVSFATMEGSK